MRRRNRLLALALPVAVLLLWTDRAPPPDWSNRFALCRPVPLIDRVAGTAVTGPEDVAYDPASGLVFISAYDRRVSADEPAGGGIYAVALAALLAARGPVGVDRISRTVDRDRQMRPHGIALWRSDRWLWLFAVLHHAAEDGSRLTRLARFRVLPGGLEAAGQIGGAAACRANDVVALDRQTAIISQTHGTCRPRWPLIGDAFDAASGRAVRLSFDDGAPVVRLGEGLGHANGVAWGADGTVYVAETRGGTLAILSDSAEGEAERVDLGGGPDNLSWAADGRLLTTLHPDLFRLALAFAGLVDHVASHVVAVDPQDGAVETLFRDPGGQFASAATAAVGADGHLLVGSVLDSALVLCRRAAPAGTAP